MFGFSYRTSFTIFTFVILSITQALVTALPTLFAPKDILPYQAWVIAIWLFILILPKTVKPF